MAIFLFLVCLCAPQHIEQELRADLNGTVVVPPALIQPISLRLENLNGVTIDQTFADPQGSFTFRGLTPGNYCLRIDHSGFSAVRQYLRVPMADTIVIRLNPLTSSSEVKPVDGRPTVDLAELALPRKAIREYEKGIEEGLENDLADSIQHFERALRIAPEYYRAHLALAEAYAKVERTADAVKQFELASSLAPADSEPFQKLGEMHLRHETYEKAADAFQEAARRSPASSRIAFQLGFAFYHLNRFPDAEASLLRARELEPAGRAASLLLVKVFLKQNKLPEARNISRSLQREPLHQ